MTKSASLPVGTYLCERGNTWLITDDDFIHLAFFSLEDDVWLQVSIHPGNYPGCEVTVISSTEEELAKYIRDRCSGWLVRKCNIEGVNIENGYVL